MKRIVARKTEDLEIHFIFAGELNSYFFNDNRLQSIILQGMKKYQIESVMVTTLEMSRRDLITKEKMIKYCKGKEGEKESVNDDLESFFEDIRLGKQPNNWVETYFLPTLTEEELDLAEGNIQDFMKTFYDKVVPWVLNPEAYKPEMQVSKLDSKFVHGWCRRRTFTLKNPLPENDSNCCSLQ